MNSHGMSMGPGSFDTLLVAASITIAVAGSFAALDLAARARVSSPGRQFFWISAAALAFGAAVWSMHFMGMLAYQAPVTVTYDATLTALSLVAVLATSWCGFNLAARRSTRWWTIPTAGGITGGGACTMHYTGMAGMQMPGEITYDPGLMAVSILCALAASILAMWLAFRKLTILQSVVGALVLGAGVSGLHYIGMAAAQMEGMQEMSVRPAIAVPKPMLALLATLGAVSIFAWIIVGALRDRWRAMQCFAREQARYQSIFDTAVDPIVVSNDKGCVISFNAAAERAFGYMSDEIIGKNVSALMPEVHQTNHDSYLERYRRTGERRVIGVGRQVEGRRKDGTTFPIDLAIAEWWSGGERYYTAILRDRTEREQAERALLRSEQRLSMAINATGGGVFEYQLPLTDDLYVSPRVCEILGYQKLPVGPRELKPWLREQIHPEDQTAWRDSYNIFLSEGGAGHDVDMRLKHQKGHWIWVRILAHAVERDHSDAICRVSGMIFDVTEQRRAQEERHRSERLALVGQMAGGVSHDFNNLLAVILGNVELLELTTDADEARILISEARDAVMRGKSLNDSLLAFAGKSKLTPQTADLGAFLQSWAPFVRRAIPSRIQLELEVDAGLPPVLIDVAMAEGCVLNVAINAREAIEGTGTIRILLNAVNRAHPNGGDIQTWVCLSVQDTGCGIPEPLQGQVFEPFFTTRSVGQGSGLGLSRVRGYLEQIGGFVTLSSAVGQGTTVAMHFEVAPIDTREEVTADQAVLASPKKRLKALVVDDAPAVARVVARMLASLGCETLIASNGTEAREIIARETGFDLLISDVVMPGESGLDLALSISRTYPSIRIALMSGYTQDKLSVGDNPDGTVFLAKPVSRAQLQEFVEAAPQARA